MVRYQKAIMDFIKRNIGFIGVVLVTLTLIVGGVILFSRNPNPEDKGRVAESVLVPENPSITGGYRDGKYLSRSETASVTMVEFGDYECPACAAYSPLVKELLTEFSGEMNFIFRNFPLPQHANANITSYAAEAAGLQGKYWEMYDLLYENQSEWAASTDAREIVIGYAKELKLDIDKFESDIDSKAVKDTVQRDLADANLLGVNSTPTFYVNGVKVSAPRNYEAFKKIIEQAIEDSPLASDGGEPYHTHFDIKTYVDGVAVNFSAAKYQSTSENPLDPNIHFHDGEGNSVHIHKEGVTLRQLFDSFSLAFSSDTASKNTKVFVNGKLNSEGLDYKPQDLDRILVSYGPTNDPKLGSQLESVTDIACIYSEKCPERGSAPSEECVGGLGSNCEI